MSRGGILATLLPAGVEVCETTGDVPESVLFRAEAAAVTKAVPKRRAEYAAVRHCARTALGRLGVPPVPILSGPDRAPRWPPGIIGALTHCEGYRAAAVARPGGSAHRAPARPEAPDGTGQSDRSNGRGGTVGRGPVSLGIDAEVRAPLPQGHCRPGDGREELRMLARLGAAAPASGTDCFVGGIGFCSARRRASSRPASPHAGLARLHRMRTDAGG